MYQHHPHGSEGSPSILIACERRDDPQVGRITVAGELDCLNAAHLHKSMIDMLRRQCPGRIEINLRAVIGLDPSAIGILLLCRADAERLGCRLTLVDPHPRVLPVLRIAGLTEQLGLVGLPISGVAAPAAGGRPPSV